MGEEFDVFGRRRRKKGFYGYYIEVGCDCHNCSPGILERHRMIINSKHLFIFRTLTGNKFTTSQRGGSGFLQIHPNNPPRRGSPKQVESKKEPYRRKLNGGVRLFRAWNMRRDGALSSLAAGYTWEPGTNESGVGSTPDMIVSDLGFHGFGTFFNTLMDVPNSSRTVFGTILCWGRVVVAEYGCRCQYAQVESLIDWGEDLDKSHMILMIAEKYNAKVIGEQTATNLAGGLIPYRREA